MLHSGCILTIFKTKRLQLREASIQDAPFIMKLVSEPAWHENISTNSINTLEKASEYIEQKMMAMYKDFGFGLWVIEKLEDSTPVGICGLLQRETLPGIDIGYALLEKYWGNGYAFEATNGCLDYAKNKLNADKVLAITKKENLRSVNLLEKTGFKYESDFSHPGTTEKLALYST